MVAATDGVGATDYTQLTMAAQFNDVRLAPDDPKSRLPTPAGRYRILLRELASEDGPVFELAVSVADVDETMTHAAVPYLG